MCMMIGSFQQTKLNIFVSIFDHYKNKTGLLHNRIIIKIKLYMFV